MAVQTQTGFESETVPRGETGELDLWLVEEHLREDFGCRRVHGDGDLEPVLAGVAASTDMESRGVGEGGEGDVEGVGEGEGGELDRRREETLEREVRSRAWGESTR